MDSIEQHIQKDKEILQDPTTNPQMRRHIEGELHELEVYVENHKKEIEDGDHHDPTAWNFIVKWNQMLTSVECTTTDD